MGGNWICVASTAFLILSCLAAGCGAHPARIVPLAPIDAAATFDCTPLMLVVQGNGAAGAGSGSSSSR